MRYDKEINILKDIEYLQTNEIMILTNCDDEESFNKSETVVRLLLKSTNWKDNTDSNNPPDFICKSNKIMMEVMRIDDHVIHKKKNPYRQIASENYRKVKDFILTLNPDFNPDDIFVNSQTELETYQDHNYLAYLANFSKTVKNHIKKIANYRQNHEGLELCFFLFDESSGNYFELNKKISESVMQGRPHIFFADEAFADVFLKSDIDYFVWYAPYKLVRKVDGDIWELPKLIFFDLKNLNKNVDYRMFRYDPTKMISNEK